MTYPFISIIIPTFCRPRQLDQCLGNLHSQTWPRDRFEVIVVDDGGTTPLDKIIEHHRDQLDVTLVRQENTGPGGARNKGAEIARGHLLAFTDDDCLPDSRWLETFASSHDQARQVFMGGTIVNGFTKNLCAVTSQLILDCAYAYHNGVPDHARFFASSNISIPADGYRELGGFSASFRIASEDRELCDRWRWRGHRLVSVPGAVVQHAKELTLTSFFRQHYNYGRGAFQFHRERARRGSLRFSPEIFRYPVFIWMLFRPVVRLPLQQMIPVTGLLLVAQLANAAGFFREAILGGR